MSLCQLLNLLQSLRKYEFSLLTQTPCNNIGFGRKLLVTIGHFWPIADLRLTLELPGFPYTKSEKMDGQQIVIARRFSVLIQVVI
jgi:hypothetical protein